METEAKRTEDNENDVDEAEEVPNADGARTAQSGRSDKNNCADGDDYIADPSWPCETIRQAALRTQNEKINSNESDEVQCDEISEVEGCSEIANDLNLPARN